MDPVAIHESLSSIADFILQYAVTLAALAVLTVALIEAYKKIFGTLAQFHRRSVLRWVAEEAPASAAGTQLAVSMNRGGHYGVEATSKATGNESVSPYDSTAAYAELMHLCTGIRVGREVLERQGADPLARNIGSALFELELGRMMAQVQEAADAALANPSIYPNLFAFITRGCTSADRDLWKASITNATDQATNREKLATVYSRVRLLMRRQLDSFQTVTTHRWAEWNQLWAWVVGAALLLGVQLTQASFQVDATISLGAIVKMAVVSLAGGILAPIAKDLVDALHKVKR